MIHRQPDLSAMFGDLRREMAELKRTVRRGKPAPNLRDLRDADLTKATDGAVPVYDSSTGRWVPGSAGARTAYLSWSEAAVPVDTLVSVGDVADGYADWTVNYDDIGLGNDGEGGLIVPDGLLIASGKAEWLDDPDGTRYFDLQGSNLWPDRRPADPVAPRHTFQTVTMNEKDPGYLYSQVSHSGTGSALGVSVTLRLALF